SSWRVLATISARTDIGRRLEVAPEPLPPQCVERYRSELVEDEVAQGPWRRQIAHDALDVGIGGRVERGVRGGRDSLCAPPSTPRVAKGVSEAGGQVNLPLSRWGAKFRGRGGGREDHAARVRFPTRLGSITAHTSRRRTPGTGPFEPNPAPGTPR